MRKAIFVGFALLLALGAGFGIGFVAGKKSRPPTIHLPLFGFESVAGQKELETTASDWAYPGAKGLYSSNLAKGKVNNLPFDRGSIEAR